jgi:hypothetical protein
MPDIIPKLSLEGAPAHIYKHQTRLRRVSKENTLAYLSRASFTMVNAL